MSFFLKSSFRHLIISLIILSPVMFAAYLFFDLIGFNPDLILLKLKGSFILHGLRAIFRLFGLEIPIFVLVSIVGSVVGSGLFMSGSDSGSSGSTNSEGGGGSDQPNFWENFDIDVLLEPFSGTQSSGTGSVNQPSEGMPVPPANPVGEQAGPGNPESFLDPYEIIGGDSIESIKNRLLNSNCSPSPEEIQFALYEAEDLFKVKVEIIREMTPLDPEGDWPGRGARALENPRTSTGEDSLENLYKLRDGVLSRNAEMIRLLKDRMVFRRANNDAASQN